MCVMTQELAAIDSVYGAGAGRTTEAPLLIGSVKSNMGHAEGCSGLAGALASAQPRIHVSSWPEKLCPEAFVGCLVSLQGMLATRLACSKPGPLQHGEQTGGDSASAAALE